MTIEATATALVQDEAMSAPEQIEAPTEYNEAAEMAAIFDRNEAEGEEAAEEAPAEATEAPQEADDAEPEAQAPDAQVDAPSDLPAAVKKAWATIPEEARTAILDGQREMGRKLADQGRQIQGIAPIRDTLVEAVKKLPELGNMRPEDVAKDVMELAQINAQFKSKPVETMLDLVKKHGLEQAMAQALSGQNVSEGAQQVPALLNEINGLKRQLAQVTDPEFMRSQFTSLTQEQQTIQSVNEFAQSQPDWSEIEPHLPPAIAFVQNLAPDASPQDVLARAYKLAQSQIKPDALKAPAPQAADEAARVVDPERSKKAQKAKSVNVSGSQPGKPRAMTEEEMMRQIYDKNQS